MSLAARTGVTFGSATQLERPGTVDFVGRALDRAARVAALPQPPDTLCLLDDEAYLQERGLLEQEYRFLSAEGPQLADTKMLKPGEPPVRYWRVVLDNRAFAGCREYFRKLREDIG